MSIDGQFDETIRAVLTGTADCAGGGVRQTVEDRRPGLGSSLAGRQAAAS
jgi:hypothetical protein